MYIRSTKDLNSFGTLIANLTDRIPICFSIRPTSTTVLPEANPCWWDFLFHFCLESLIVIREDFPVGR